MLRKYCGSLLSLNLLNSENIPGLASKHNIDYSKKIQRIYHNIEVLSLRNGMFRDSIEFDSSSIQNVAVVLLVYSTRFTWMEDVTHDVMPPRIMTNMMQFVALMNTSVSDVQYCPHIYGLLINAALAQHKSSLLTGTKKQGKKLLPDSVTSLLKLHESQYMSLPAITHSLLDMSHSRDVRQVANAITSLKALSFLYKKTQLLHIRCVVDDPRIIKHGGSVNSTMLLEVDIVDMLDHTITLYNSSITMISLKHVVSSSIIPNISNKLMSIDVKNNIAHYDLTDALSTPTSNSLHNRNNHLPGDYEITLSIKLPYRARPISHTHVFTLQQQQLHRNIRQSVNTAANLHTVYSYYNLTGVKIGSSASSDLHHVDKSTVPYIPIRTSLTSPINMKELCDDTEIREIPGGLSNTSCELLTVTKGEVINIAFELESIIGPRHSKYDSNALKLHNRTEIGSNMFVHPQQVFVVASPVTDRSIEKSVNGRCEYRNSYIPAIINRTIHKQHTNKKMKKKKGNLGKYYANFPITMLQHSSHSHSCDGGGDCGGVSPCNLLNMGSKVLYFSIYVLISDNSITTPILYKLCVNVSVPMPEPVTDTDTPSYKHGLIYTLGSAGYALPELSHTTEPPPTRASVYASTVFSVLIVNPLLLLLYYYYHSTSQKKAVNHMKLYSLPACYMCIITCILLSYVCYWFNMKGFSCYAVISGLCCVCIPLYILLGLISEDTLNRVNETVSPKLDVVEDSGEDCKEEVTNVGDTVQECFNEESSDSEGITESSIKSTDICSDDTSTPSEKGSVHEASCLKPTLITSGTGPNLSDNVGTMATPSIIASESYDTPVVPPVVTPKSILKVRFQSESTQNINKESR